MKVNYRVLTLLVNITLTILISQLLAFHIINTNHRLLSSFHRYALFTPDDKLY